MWSIYISLAWEDFLANLENTTRSERDPGWPCCVVLEEMKQICGTQTEAPIMEDLSNSDVEGIGKNRGTDERGTSANV